MKSLMNDRLQALAVLQDLIDKKISLSTQKAGLKLTPLSQEICFGVCRDYFRLTVIADSLVKKRPKELDVWLCLLIGLYQLYALNIPSYAVVKETVGLLDTLKKPWAKALVNAVLRNYSRQHQALLSQFSSNNFFQANHPQWLIEAIRDDWPLEWLSILQANNERSPMSLRVNPRQISRPQYLQALESQNIAAQALAFSEVGIKLGKPCPVQELPHFSSGFISVQDEAAQLVLPLLSLKPNLRVLDACSAPGGKTCHILESEPRIKECVSLDIDEHRLKRVEQNLARLSLKTTLIQGDATTPNMWWDGQPFDRILLDAPCSATGVIRRHPDIKLLRTKEDILQVTALQKSLLESLWPLLAPNGILVYATCSILSVENEQQIRYFIQQHNDCKFTPCPAPWAQETGHGWQVLPGQNGMDGFFYSVLTKIKPS